MSAITISKNELSFVPDLPAILSTLCVEVTELEYSIKFVPKRKKLEVVYDLIQQSGVIYRSHFSYSQEDK